MTAEREIVPLRSLCSDFKSAIVDGPFGSNLKREHYTTSGSPVLKIQNVREFSLNANRLDYVTFDKARELSRHSFREGDIVMTKLGDPLGVSAIVENSEPGIIVADLVRIRADKVDTKFLCYQLNSPKIRAIINAQQQGATRPRVQISMVRDLPIWAPSLTEQRRIVAVLDEAFAAIATATVNAEKNLANAREVFTSFVYSSLHPSADGRRQVRFGDFCRLQRGFDLPTKDRRPGAVPLVSSSGVIDAVDQARVPGPGVVTGRSGSIGNVFFEAEDFWPLNTTLYVKEFFGNVPRFVFHFLRAFDLSRYSTGAGVPTLNRNFVNDSLIWVPQPDTQQRLANAFDEVELEAERLSGIYRAKSEYLNCLKHSLLDRAFSGELTQRELVPA